MRKNNQVTIPGTDTTAERGRAGDNVAGKRQVEVSGKPSGESPEESRIADGAVEFGGMEFRDIRTLSAGIDAFDKRVDELLERFRGNKIADKVAYSVSAVADHSIIWMIFAVFRLLRGKRHGLAGVRAILAVFGESALINLGVKNLVNRHRPPFEDLDHPHPLRKPLTSSFPSGHSSAAFCAATLLADDDPLMAPIYYTVAAAAALSRVYVRVHHASDVVGGVAIGRGLGKLGLWALPLPQTSRKAMKYSPLKPEVRKIICQDDHVVWKG